MQAGVYRHYKGGYYQVLGVAEHTESKELMVVYISLTGAHLPGPRMHVRPYPAFIEIDVMSEDGIHWVRRFEYVGDEIPREV